MTDSDVLVRAAKALRQAHDGTRAGSGFTRARVMNTLHRERRRRILRWAVASPLASVLLVGSAWAQSTGQWPVIWQAVTSVFVAPPRQPEPVHSRAQRPEPRRGTEQRSPGLESGQPDAATQEAIVPAPLPEVDEPEPSSLEPVQPLAPKPSRARSKRRTVEPRPVVAPDEKTAREAPRQGDRAAPERGPDGELSRFRAAHDLHFMGDRPRDAIAAYEGYLREYPSGRFVPEARYNIALDRIKLGDKAAARAALAPFADGRYGSYRQKEAAQLLDALR